MTLKFTKMHGLGNDFVMLDGIGQTLSLSTDDIRFIADRHFGVGCDQLLIVEKSDTPEADFRYRIFNADGGEVQQCGNGARCFARFVIDKGLTEKHEIRVETLSGIITLKVQADGEVTVNMGVPGLNPSDLPMDLPAREDEYSLVTAGRTILFSAVSMGNPHIVLQVDDVDTAPVESLGAALESHPLFPKRVNVGFMQIIDPSNYRLRVFERGSGETLACGTGACAAMVAGRLAGLLDANAQASLKGGKLSLQWEGEGQPVFMTGPAVTVFEGNMEHITCIS